MARQSRLQPLIGRLASMGILEVVATATPGIKDLLILGRIKAFTEEDTYDLIVVDAPAAGHAVGLRSRAASETWLARACCIDRRSKSST